MTKTELREKLVKLIAEAKRQWEGGTNNIDARIADHLIANGVTFAKDTDVPTKWIRIADRAPKFFETALCVDMRGNIFIGKNFEFLHKEDNYMHCCEKVGSNVVGCKIVTHWMPLPSLPKEE